MNNKAFTYLKGFAGLVRWPNLLIIILTQVLLRYGVLKTFLYSGDLSVVSGLLEFALLVAATVFIAAGGYIINDYFDVAIDKVNRPDKMVIERLILPRTAYILYWVITGMGVLCGFVLAVLLKSVSYGLIFHWLAIILYIYSLRYKRTFLLGNLIVAFLSAMVVLMVWLTDFLFLRANPDSFVLVINYLKPCATFVIGYSLFAFFITLFREMIKDIEDAEGDRAHGSSTLPVLYGTGTAKMIITVLIVITFGILIYGLLILFRRGMLLTFGYLIFSVQLPLLYLIYKLIKAGTREDFHFLSSLSKLIMLAGILSMQLISIST
jgi:4-hydroxybenzoate polyprenyltransferase